MDFTQNNNIGEIILKLRFSAKFHMQMCAVLSQAKNHREALRHALIGSYLCEDNLLKSYLLCNLVNEEAPTRPSSNHEKLIKNKPEKEGFNAFKEKNNGAEKILSSILGKIKNLKQALNETREM